GQRGEYLRKVAADLGTDLGAECVGGRAGDLHPIGDAGPSLAEPLDAMDRSHHDVAEVGLVDEQLGLDSLCDPKLNRLLPARGHRDATSGGERAVELDPLDVAVPVRPSADVRPLPPDRFWRRRRLDAVFGYPHGDLLALVDAFPHSSATRRTTLPRLPRSATRAKAASASSMRKTESIA